MRLQKVQHHHNLKARLVFGIIRLMSGFRAQDVVRTLLYREDFFGSHHSRLTQAVLRGSSYWSVGERELFAAFVSRLNQCPF